MRSQSIEDYLKAIHLLQEKEGVARTGALASQLGITAGSVTEMVKRLAGMSPRLITYRQHQGVVLTDHGCQAALAVIRRHRLLETFLHQVLGLGWDAVHEEAEVLEHHLSDRMVEAIDRHLDHPRFDPHGEPIPDAAGHMRGPAGRRLSDLEKGCAFRVVRVDPTTQGMLGHLDDLGIHLGSRGVLEGWAPYDGPGTLRIIDQDGVRERVVGREVARRIFVLPE